MFNFILLLFGLTIIKLIIIYTIKPVKSHCKLHEWVWKGEVGNEYLVCKVCKYLPGNDMKEESDGKEQDH